MIKSLLIANRGEIACRVIRTCRRLGIRSIAVYSEADRSALHVRSADEAVAIGPAESKASYLDLEKITAAAQQSKAEAVHPGYGFLSENSAFAERLSAAGVLFVGPRAETIRLMGDKLQAKALAERAQVPTVPGITLAGSSAQDMESAAKFGKQVGYPILIKAAAGGGGRGMRKVFAESELPSKLEGASREAQAFFNDGRVFIEKLVERARHIEVQIFGDSHGNVIHLFDRDCTLQRNHQKVIEEAPAPNLAESTRTALHAAAVRLGQASKYLSAGTVEFLVDQQGHFYFLEVNSRLQVEHPVTELITGLDLVELQLRIASGEGLPELTSNRPVQVCGAALEFRICAEAPEENFRSSTGLLSRFEFPVSAPGVRLDAGFENGDRVTHFYDSLLAKLIISGATRAEVLTRARRALAHSQVIGVRSNLGFLGSLINSTAFDQVTHSIETAEQLLASEEPHHLRRMRTVAALDLLSDVLAADPGARHFRIFGQPRLAHSVRVNGIEISVELKLQAPGIYRLDQDGIVIETDAAQSSSFLVAGSPVRAEQLSDRYGRRWLATSFGSFQLESLEVRLKQRADQRDRHSGSIQSTLPGKVVAVKVKPGDVVEAGSTLLVIESMKMEHQVKAPLNGEVKTVHVAAGDTVEAGRVLAELQYS
ncbi:MAG: biotin/lipoyl-binding protein [Oligoflexia bacterium]|nr:biotin/lipoyl-binding protein [Oligoflexia bacterium]